jgi:hypothetical protein
MRGARHEHERKAWSDARGLKLASVLKHRTVQKGRHQRRPKRGVCITDIKH